MSDVILPSSWLWTTLGEICSHPQYGYTTKAAESGDTLFLRTTDITSGKIEWDTVPFCAESPDDPDKYQLHDGDIVISRAGSVGFSHLVQSPPKAVFASYLIRFRPFIDRHYFALFLKSPFYWHSISDSKSGIAVGNVNAQKLAAIPIPLPPLAEQKRIVAKIEELFSELEAGEESLRVARRQLGVYRQSLLKKAFEGKLTAQWRTQNRDKLGKPLTASTKLDVEPGPLPLGWIWQTINEVADVTGGLTKNSKRDSLPLRIPYLRVANVYANELRLDEIKDIGVTAAEANKVRLVKGDLLIVEGNGSLDQIGRVAAWNGSIGDCGHQNHLIRARCHPNAHYAFVLLFLLSPHGRDVIEKHAASTSGLHTLSVSKVQRLPVPLCSLPEQQEIVRLLDEQFEAIERNEREIDAALQRSEALRQAILKKAATGRLVPQAATDEPASALLVRLRAERTATGQLASEPRQAAGAGPDDWFPEVAGSKSKSAKPRQIRRPGTTDLQAGIVALAIDRFGRRNQFLGHTNAEKVVHLADCLADLQLDRQPVKDAAGPNDFRRAKEIEHRARVKGWFRVTKDGAVYHYHPGRNLPALLETTERKLGPKFTIVENLLTRLGGLKDTKAIEIFATVYAAWNNLLLRKAPISEEAIVTEARENWHPRKLEIDRKRFFGAITWMKQNRFVPNGTGRLVERAESS